jgi:hypothetical protein
MSRSRHTDAQIAWVLKQLEAGREAEEVARACCQILPPLFATSFLEDSSCITAHSEVMQLVV